MSQNNETELTDWQKIELKRKISGSKFEDHMQNEFDRFLFPEGKPQRRFWRSIPPNLPKFLLDRYRDEEE